MTVARELKLIKEEDRYLVTSLPVEELKKYRGPGITKNDFEVNNNKVALNSSEVDLAKAEIRFSIPDLKESTYNFRLSNEAGEEFIVSYDHAQKEFIVNRSNAGQTEFSEKFAAENSTAPRISSGSYLDVILIIDKTSIEMFFDNGKTVMTEIFFPNQPWTEFSFTAGNEAFRVENFEAFELEFPAQVENENM